MLIDEDDYTFEAVKMARIERIADNTIWGCFYLEDGKTVHFTVSARGKLNLKVEEHVDNSY